MEVGFQLSYLAVLGIVLLQPRIYQWWQPRWLVVDKIWALTCVSIAAQLSTFPLALYYFHQFPNYFLLSNLVVIPAASIILPLGISVVVFSPLPALSMLLGIALQTCLSFLNSFIKWIEHLPFAVVDGIDIYSFEVAGIYIAMCITLMFFITKRFAWLTTSVFIIICLAAVNTVEAWIQSRQEGVVFYKIGGLNAASLYTGHHQLFISDMDLRKHQDEFRYAIQPHWRYIELGVPDNTLKAGFYQKAGLVSNGRFTLLTLNDHSVIDTIGRVDVLWIQERTLQHPDKILDRVSPGSVVLSNNLDWKSRNYWDHLLSERGISFHNMDHEGSVSFELDL